MSKEARLAAARERVKRWKADKQAHGYSLKQQWLRRYARQKAGRLRVMKERVRKAPKVQYAHYGETHTGDIEGVDTGYGKMEPKNRGGHGGVDPSMGQRDEPGVSGADISQPIQETENEANTYAELELFKAKRALKERRGVAVEIEL